MRLGQVEHLLPALAEADAPQPPRAEGDERLHELEPDAARVERGVQEGEEPLRPVAGSRRLEEDERQGREDGHREVPYADAAREEHQEEEADRQRRGAEVRLEQEQPRHQANHHAVRHDADREVRYPLALLAERARQVEDQGHLGRLRGLQAEGTDVQPAPRPAPHQADARDEDQNERHDARSEQGIGQAPVRLRGQF